MKAWDLGHIITDYINSRGDKVSHKKLQKLLYYVEAWHLVHFDKSIIDEEFEAWIHGPVVVELYHKLKEFGFNNLKVIEDESGSVEKEIQKIVRNNNLSDDQLDLISSVLNKYGGLTSMELELLTHSEDPWNNARKGFAPHQNCNEKIDKGEMKKYYSFLNG